MQIIDAFQNARELIINRLKCKNREKILIFILKSDTHEGAKRVGEVRKYFSGIFSASHLLLTSIRILSLEI